MNKTTVISILILVFTIIASMAIQTSTAQTTIGVHSDFPHARVVVTEVIDGDTIRISPQYLLMAHIEVLLD